MNMENETIIQDFSFTRNLSSATTRLYKSAINIYSKFCKMGMEELIMEAEQDEEKGVRWKYRKVKKRLMKFRVYLYKNFLESTAKKYFQLILTVYRHYEIELQKLPSISDKNTIKNKPVQYSDLPDREVIEKVLNVANIRGRAMIFFIVSSGCARMETANLKIKDYVDATIDYHGCDDVYDALEVMKGKIDIVPTFKIWRQKTKKFYVTFCSPEAVNAINIYLNSYEDELFDDDRLFHANPRYISDLFARLNDKLCLGHRGSFNRFRPHMLRKVHASSLHNDGMSIDLIDRLQGRVRDNVHRAYFLDNPERLREEYVNHVGAVSIEWNCRNLTFKSKEYLELERENYERGVALEELSDRLGSVESFVFEGMNKGRLDVMKSWIR